MPRNRGADSAHLPPNLYRRADRRGFRYKGESWEYWPLAEADAIRAAIARNATRTNNPNSIYRVIERFKVWLGSNGHAASTMREKLRILNWYARTFGQFPFADMTRKVLLAHWQTIGPHAWAKHRSLWIDLYRFAISEGVCESNEAEKALPPQLGDRVTGRHTQAGYDAIYAAAPEWLQIAMELAVSSLQDRSTLVVTKKTDIVGNVWKATRGKTGAHLAIEIPMGSRLAAAVERALSQPVFGSYLIRRTPQRRSHALREFTQVRDELLSKEFAKAREKAKAYANVPIEQRPAFHSLRSFGADLYRQAGHSTEYVKALMAHKSIKMTEYYQSGYQVQYVKVEAGLK